MKRQVRQVRQALFVGWLHARWARDDRGEGVVSMSIAVLVVAALGALMWVGLQELWFEAEANTRDRVAEIGR